ncbi:hypothetical protein ASPZODRAFT_24287 [Penicilliopsis zonata CBS 506.65]|uniref:Carboxylic ester hydrolase n=1 Tax=Penicilliopsis zonata CBS 506.65 TaxID=1073090 RepID=A0A1L9SNJ4_9EURO|nr:hypothetical protein ASPZODRAFT_24287 [Penicilliopsis zonata CBS 506.65]OJJ48681.1 hypothetical protein ASPZODRAFT_24287 [Penicilliopsis zonata CBS 506.65]
MIYHYFFSVLIAALVSRAATASFAESCRSFSVKLADNNTPPGGIVEYVSAGTDLPLPYNDPSCNRPNQTVTADLCRIALDVSTSNLSSVVLELWLPRNWTGRFLATGNGGIDGCIKYEDLAYGAAHGFAVVGSNNGHNGTSGRAFYQNEDVVIDFSWRALHTIVEIGKNLTSRFYGYPHRTSYYLGCSLGGRQGINAADRFPGDFDGIVAGSPAVDFNNLVSWRASFFPLTGSYNSSEFITRAQWTGLIHDEILRQCDGIDGVWDGIIEDPTLCHFHPDPLACTTTAHKENCLSAVQIETVRRIFSPLLAGDGELIFPAMQPGSEDLAVERLYAGKPFSYSEDWFKYVVFDPSWNPAYFNLYDAETADALNPAEIRTWPSDLSAFHARGGKMITFHGQQDNQITSFNSIRFYDRLAAGGMQTGAEQMEAFFRFFRISGMFHCNTGPGAWVVGQGGGASAAGIPFARENNVLAALVAWVEDEIAPDTILGTKFVNDEVGRGIQMQRRHCRYPLRNTYIGGNASLPDSWMCL